MKRPGRRTLTALGGVALAAVVAVGLVQAQENAPPPLIFDDPPPPTQPIEEAPPPADVPPPAADPVPPPVTTAAPDPVPAQSAEKEDEKEDAEEKAEAPPLLPEPEIPTGKRTRYGSVVLQALDKITAETIRFEARVGVPVKWRGLVFTVRSCEVSNPDEVMQDSIAYVQIRSEPRSLSEKQTSREVFRGWMFASSPGLAPLEHPLYDAWVIACKASPPIRRG